MSDVTETRWLRIECYSEHPEVVKVAEMLVDKYLQSEGKVRNKDEITLDSYIHDTLSQ